VSEVLQQLNDMKVSLAPFVEKAVAKAEAAAAEAVKFDEQYSVEGQWVYSGGGLVATRVGSVDWYTARLLVCVSEHKMDHTLFHSL